MNVLLADNLSLPPRVVTESIAVIGRKTSGKTYTAGKLFEEMYGIGAQCVVLDVVGNWWGLRLSASGKGSGLSIPVFGGDRGDIPITPKGGKLMAQTVVERGISCVIDLMSFRPTQRKEFVIEFAEELFELKKRNRSPLHLFLEEARKFIPQQQRSKLDTRMIEAFEDIVRLGRNYGLGVSLLDQRPQSVNKEVLSQTELLIVHQLVEKLGRKEIEDWVRSKTVEGGEELDKLAELQPGEAFVWSPGMLRTFKRVKVAKKKTYDASDTPKLGDHKAASPRPLSSKDLEGLKQAMAAVVEQAEANDPAKLREQLKRVRAELEAAKRAPPAPAKTKEKVVEIPVQDPKLVKQSMDLEAAVAKALSPIGAHVTQAVQLLARFTTNLGKAAAKAPAPAAPVIAPKAAHPPRLPARSTPTTNPGQIEVLTGPEQRILEALAWLESLGGDEAPLTEAVAFMAGYRPGGGAFGNPKSHLRVMGLIEYLPGGRMRRTGEGCVVAPTPATPPTHAELHTAVLGRLSGPEGRILKPLLDVWPESLTNEQLAELAGYSPDGGAFGNPRSRLRTLGLVDYPTKGSVRANDFLFP